MAQHRLQRRLSSFAFAEGAQHCLAGGNVRHANREAEAGCDGIAGIEVGGESRRQHLADPDLPARDRLGRIADQHAVLEIPRRVEAGARADGHAQHPQKIQLVGETRKESQGVRTVRQARVGQIGRGGVERPSNTQPISVGRPKQQNHGYAESSGDRPSPHRRQPDSIWLA